MLLSKFKILYFLVSLLSSVALSADFSDTECLKSSFETKVEHKVLWKLSRSLKVKKESCLIVLDFHKFNQYLSSKWSIDVCRAPIHIKEGSDSVDVIKRESQCNTGSKDIYCKKVIELEKVIQDNGLIFAQGEKENLSSPHGQVHCTNLLLNAYLKRGVVLNHNQDIEGRLRPSPTIKDNETLNSPKPTLENFVPASTGNQKDEHTPAEGEF